MAEYDTFIKKIMKFYCNEQLAGVASLDFHLIDETNNWPAVITDTTSGQINIVHEDVEVEAVLDEQTLKIKVDQKTSEKGNLWDIKVEYALLSRSESLEQIMDQYENKPGILVACLNNGFKKLYGSNVEPLYMNYDTVEGDAIDDAKSGTTVKIIGKTRQRPVYYTPIETSS